MKKIIIALTLLSSSTVFAISDENLVEKCAEVGAAKVFSQAQSYNCKVLQAPVVTGIDNRFYNPSKYVWYASKVDCEQRDSVQVLVQYYRGKCL